MFCSTPEERYTTAGHLHSLSNVMVAVEKPAEADLSLGVGHFTQQRWDKFLRDYTDDTFKDFLQNCLDARQIVEGGYTCPVRANHAYGNCLIAVSCGETHGR